MNDGRWNGIEGFLAASLCVVLEGLFWTSESIERHALRWILPAWNVLRPAQMDRCHIPYAEHAGRA
jgi:hypothetical protein